MLDIYKSTVVISGLLTVEKVNNTWDSNFSSYPQHGFITCQFSMMYLCNWYSMRLLTISGLSLISVVYLQHGAMNNFNVYYFVNTHEHSSCGTKCFSSAWCCKQFIIYLEHGCQ